MAVASEMDSLLDGKALLLDLRDELQVLARHLHAIRTEWRSVKTANRLSRENSFVGGLDRALAATIAALDDCDTVVSRREEALQRRMMVLDPKGTREMLHLVNDMAARGG